jgi:hypothetical protein
VPPSTQSNRFYVSTRFCPDRPNTGLDIYGRLYRIDIQLSIVQRVKVVWTYDYLLPQPLSPSTTCPSSTAFGSEPLLHTRSSTTTTTRVNPSTGRITAVTNDAPLIFGSPLSSSKSSTSSTSMMMIADVNNTPKLQRVTPLPSEPQSIALSSSGDQGYSNAWLTWPSSPSLWKINTTSADVIAKFNVSTITGVSISSITSRITIGRLPNGNGVALVFAVTCTSSPFHTYSVFDANVGLISLAYE